MIKKHFFFTFLLLMGSVISFTSCSSSDDDGDNGTLDPPAYKSSSALYQVTSSNSKYSSIEFTESGSYIVVAKSAINHAMQNTEGKKFSFAMAPWVEASTRATTSGNIITGKYTVDGNKYILEGFGTITVNTSGDTTVSLEIAETGSEPYTLTAAKKNQMPGSEQTDKLCRSWKVASLGMKASFNVEGAQSFNFDKTVEGGNIAELMATFYADMMNWAANLSRQYGEEIPQDMLNKQIEEQKKEIYKAYTTFESVIFSQAGTYMVTYGNGTLAVATWAWKDNSNSVLQYSWNYANMNASGASGECGIQFKGSKCIMTENQSANNIDTVVKGADMTMTYTLEEIK